MKGNSFRKATLTKNPRQYNYRYPAQEERSMEQNSTIQKAIRSPNLAAFIIAAVAILLLALLVAFNIKPLYNHFAGPFEFSSEELISYQGPQDTFRTYVTGQPSVALDTNFYFYEKQVDGSNKVIHSYYALMFDDRLLLAKFPGAARGDILQPEPVTGKIVTLSDQENAQVLQALMEEFPNLEEVFLPYILDTTANDGSVWLAIIGIVILVGLSIWSLVNLIRPSGDSSKRPSAPEISNSDDRQQTLDLPM